MAPQDERADPAVFDNLCGRGTAPLSLERGLRDRCPTQVLAATELLPNATATALGWAGHFPQVKTPASVAITIRAAVRPQMTMSTDVQETRRVELAKWGVETSPPQVSRRPGQGGAKPS
ncbi:hypothetical protein [Streptomyces sp. NBC_01518]|uniref:hypothetical protein n=1 Tax=Streptomyces sp. NBC_01518 TaxID=2903891 RepID=UPI0038706D78